MNEWMNEWMIEMKWNEMKWSEVKWSEMNEWMKWMTWMNDMEWNEMKWNEMRWNEMEWNGMEWNGMKWNEMQCNEMEWNGMEWSVVLCCVLLRYVMLCYLPLSLSLHRHLISLCDALLYYIPSCHVMLSYVWASINPGQQPSIRDHVPCTIRELEAESPPNNMIHEADIWWCELVPSKTNANPECFLISQISQWSDTFFDSNQGPHRCQAASAETPPSCCASAVNGWRAWWVFESAVSKIQQQLKRENKMKQWPYEAQDHPILSGCE
jgi:hypothetical protein